MSILDLIKDLHVGDHCAVGRGPNYLEMTMKSDLDWIEDEQPEYAEELLEARKGINDEDLKDFVVIYYELSNYKVGAICGEWIVTLIHGDATPLSTRAETGPAALKYKFWQVEEKLYDWYSDNHVEITRAPPPSVKSALKS